MNISIHSAFVMFAFVLTANSSIAQSLVDSDQNPNYMVSRDKYMKIADSVTAWHSTTPQETYKAIDYLEDKREAREERRQFRRELRLERARRWNWNNDWYDSPVNYYGYGRFNSFNNWNRWNNWNFRNRYYHNNFLGSTLPAAITFGLLCR